MPPKSDEKPMDSKFEFWNLLPNEMRVECIKRMDFKSRMQLRAASKQDKVLVESAPKYQFDNVKVELDVEYMPSVTCNKFNQSEVKIEQKNGKTTPEFLEKAHWLVAQTLKFAKTESFEFCSKFPNDDAVSKFLKDISELAPFRFKNIILDCGKFEIIDFFLKNCTSLESIELERCDNNIDNAQMMELINLPSVINTKIVRMVDLKTSEISYQLITNWIEKMDNELGKTLQIRIQTTNLLDFLAEKFENRTVSKIDGTLRIRTNDAGKHILIRSIPDKVGYFSFHVIPSEQKESEYEKDDEWVTELTDKEVSRMTTQIRLTMFNLDEADFQNIIRDLSVDDYEPDYEDYEGYYEDLY